MSNNIRTLPETTQNQEDEWYPVIESSGDKILENKVKDMCRASQLIYIGDQNSFHIGSFRIFLKLLDLETSFLIVIRLWYLNHHQHPDWKDWFVQEKHSWLYTLYQKYCDQNVQCLANFLQGNAQTA